MRTNAWSILILAALFVGVSTPPVAADVSSDRAAAILIFPRAVAARVVQTEEGEANSDITVDTVFQISNVSDETVEMQCFYVNANGHCSISGLACGALGSESGIGIIADDQENCPIAGEFCIPGWVETDFRVYLTPRQPIAWRLSDGLARERFPLDGTAFVGPRGESNAGSAVPPATLEPGFAGDLDPDETRTVFFFAGELKCVVVDAEGRGIARNVLKGEADVVSLLQIVDEEDGTDIDQPLVQRYNAIGIQAIDGDTNGDGVLELGGEAGEYNGCPNVLIADHFFTQDEGDLTALTLVPCAENLRAQIPGSTTAQFLVFNEFEQRFSTSRPVDCYFNRFLPFIDTLDPERSIWSTNVSGTIAGQTRIRGVSGGLLGVLTERPFFLFGAADSSNNLHFAGERLAPDLIVLP